jgi:hypothetical protein
MTNAQDWIEGTRFRLMSGHQEQLNRLKTAYVAGSGTMVFDFDMAGIRSGTVISVGTSTFYVWEANVNLKSATVQANWDGTLDQDLPAGSIVRVAPRFTDAQILRAINEDIHDLSSPSSGLFQIGTAELTYDSASVGYDLSAAPNMISPIELRVENPGSFKEWTRIPSFKFRIVKGAPTGDEGFESGMALFLYDTWAGATGDRLHLTYRKGFNQLSNSYSTKIGTGIPSSAWDIPPIGAAISLMAGREIKRSFVEAQGDSRRAAEVTAGTSTSSVRALIALRQQRITAEKQRLDGFYPIIKDA